MIYIPDTTNKCYVVQSEGVLRGYKTTPSYNTTVEYRDYYIKSDYMYKDGTQSFGDSRYTTLPTCLASDVITDSPYYRVDFDSILIMLLIMCIFCFGIPLKVFFRLFRRLR